MSEQTLKPDSQKLGCASQDARSPKAGSGVAPCSPSFHPLFQPGTVGATRGALDLLMRAGVSYQGLLERHLCGDWSDMDREDWAANTAAVESGARIFSSFDVQGLKIWIITEAVSDITEDGRPKSHPSRSSTCFLLPEEY